MSSDNKPRIVELQPIGRRVKVSAGETVLEAAQSAGVELQAVCGGKGTCGNCQVRLVSGRLSKPSIEEREKVGKELIRSGCRLACQAVPESNVTVEIPAESLTASQRVQIESEEVRIQVDVPPSASGRKRRRPILGLAVDLGTTKIAAYLVDLETGETLSRQGLMNPQVAYGEDVISRIAYASRSPECEKRLQRKVIDALNQVTGALCREAGTSEENVIEAVLAGNTAMHHLFAGLPVQQLGAAPYLPAMTAPFYKAAKKFGLHLAEDARVYMPANIAGYVGGDHVAMLLGSGVSECPKPALAIDIGTNTELTLKANGRLVTCSCASGPAFEGAHIKHGMRAGPGAIERVFFHEGAMHCYTIERRPASGICGSGILDAIAALLDAGAVDERGNFRTDAAGVRRSGGHTEFVLVSAPNPEKRGEIVITREDISEIQFAKAAIRAGIEVLLEVGQVEARSLNQFVIAGAFGSYLDLRSAVRIGMFPDIPVQRFKQVGNAAGLGARQMLASAGKRREGEALAQRIEYIELTNHRSFHERFVKALFF